jgi:hypothetical protein
MQKGKSAHQLVSLEVFVNILLMITTVFLTFKIIT